MSEEQQTEQTEKSEQLQVELSQDGTVVEQAEEGDGTDFGFPNKMDIRIVSDGTRTSVFDSEGRALGLIQSIVWKQNVAGMPICKITLLKVPVNVVARGTKMKYKSAYKLHRSKERVAPPIKEEPNAPAANSDSPAATTDAA